MKALSKSVMIICAYLAGMIVVGSSAGLLVKWLSEPWMIQEWVSTGVPWPPDFKHDLWMSMLYGSIYATGLWSTVLGVRHLAYKYIPIRNVKSIALHIGLIAIAAVAVFTLLEALDPAICLLVKGEPPPDDKPAVIITVVSMGATVIIAMIMYSVDFYRDMRRARQTALVAELRALRAQINPHFLFNTLNSIAALVHKKPDEAEYVVEELADLFRYTLRASQYPTVSLADELTATNRYLAIENARFRDRMTVIREVDESILDARVPSLLIQPLVENAVKHGVSKTEDHCGISLKISRQEESILLSVRDTGPGFFSTDPGEVFVNGTGLANVRDRLHLHFGTDATFTILNDGVELAFPYRVEADTPLERLPEFSTDKH